MRRSAFLHTLLNEVLESINRTVSWTDSTDNTGGVYTLNGVCNFRYVYPGMYVIISGESFKVQSYSEADKTITVKAASGTPGINALSLTLRLPFFCHGSPIRQEGELAAMKGTNQTKKQIMVYLMEPYEDEPPTNVDSSIDTYYDFVLCFLCEAKTLTSTTDDLYYSALRPMRNLMEDFMLKLERSSKFYGSNIKKKPKNHAAFGINVRDSGTKKPYFTENLSGISVSINAGVYQGAVCDDCSVEAIPVIPSGNCPVELGNCPVELGDNLFLSPSTQDESVYGWTKDPTTDTIGWSNDDYSGAMLQVGFSTNNIEQGEFYLFETDIEVVSLLPLGSITINIFDITTYADAFSSETDYGATIVNRKYKRIVSGNPGGGNLAFIVYPSNIKVHLTNMSLRKMTITA